MKPLDSKVEASLFDFAPQPRLVFKGNPHAATTSAWAFGASAKPHAAFAPSSLRFSTTPSDSNGALPAAAIMPNPTPKLLKELSGEALDSASSTEPAVLIQGVEVLRVFVEAEELPFALLGQVHVQVQILSTFREMHLCVQLQLRPTLQDIYDNVGLKRALMSTMRKWAASNTPLKFFFPLPHITATASVHFGDYQEVDLATAIAGLHEGTVELTEILRKAEDRSGTLTDPTTTDATSASSDDYDAMDIDELL